LIAATRHDRLAAADYVRLRNAGMATARDGMRWHLIERSPGRYDFSSLLPMVRAAREAGVQVIWDLLHYGWPEGLDIFRPEFVDRFAEFARAVTERIAEESDEPPILAPVNEISFWSWAGGDTAHLDPYDIGRGFELKTQLVRACLAAVDAIWSVEPRARIVHTDPAVHILPNPERPELNGEAEGYRMAQYQAWDMITGRLWPQLGGDERFLDLLGVNYYPYNQWIYKGPSVGRDSSLYRPLREILAEVHERYGRPLLLAETGSQGEDRAAWLAYVGEEVRAALRAGVPVHGICLYPILDYPGWEDDRCCEVGLWGYAGPRGDRAIHEPLARELARQTELFRREALEETAGALHSMHSSRADEMEPPEEESDRHAAF
jgi:hypothetical protein